MNYIIYNEQMQIVDRKDTFESATAAGNAWQKQWAMQGCPNKRHFTVVYNGSEAKTVFNSRIAAQAVV